MIGVQQASKLPPAWWVNQSGATAADMRRLVLTGESCALSTRENLLLLLLKNS